MSTVGSYLAWSQTQVLTNLPRDGMDKVGETVIIAVICGGGPVGMILWKR